MSVEAAANASVVTVIDVFGSTEGGIALDRTGRRAPSSVGRLRQGIKVVDEDGSARPRAPTSTPTAGSRTPTRVSARSSTRIGVGPFEGYYRNDEAMRRTTRNGWYWSGDLGYVDDDGWVYFAGRTSDWLRVDGENFPAAPIEAIMARHPDVMLASVYGVPDARLGRPGDGAARPPGRRDLRRHVVRRVAGRPAAISAPKWRPGYVRVVDDACRRRRPTRCSPAPSSTRSSARTAWAATPCTCGTGAAPPSAPSPKRTNWPSVRCSSPMGAAKPGNSDSLRQVRRS